MFKKLFAVSIAAFLGLAVAGPGSAIAAPGPAVRDAPMPRTMLFVGNSFTYYNNNLHGMVRRIAQSMFPDKPKKHMFYKSLTLSGSYLSDLAPGAGHMIKDYAHKRKNGPWDLVVLQPQSREPISKKKSEGFQKSVRHLDKMVRDAGAKTVLFMTWAYKNKPEMAQPLADAYTATGNALNAMVVPVGLAFERARTTDPSMELYIKDKKHPSLLGSYLAGNVFFAALYGKSSVGAPYTAGLSAKEAKFAQEVAWKTVQAYYGR